METYKPKISVLLLQSFYLFLVLCIPYFKYKHAPYFALIIGLLYFCNNIYNQIIINIYTTKRDLILEKKGWFTRKTEKIAIDKIYCHFKNFPGPRGIKSYGLLISDANNNLVIRIDAEKKGWNQSELKKISERINDLKKPAKY